jgi:membrane protein
MRKWFKTIFGSMRSAFAVLRRTDPLILASSTAFFATFALSPILIILGNLLSLYPSSFRFNNQLFKTIGATVGKETSNEIQIIVNNFKNLEGNIWLTVGGTIFLFFVATTMLIVVKHGINKIWHIRPKPEVRFRYHSRERGVGIGFLIITAVLFAINFFIDSMMAVSMDYLIVTWPEPMIKIIQVFHSLFGVIIITLWFTLVLKWLPDARLSWDVALSGGLLTGLLFSVGKNAFEKSSCSLADGIDLWRVCFNCTPVVIHFLRVIHDLLRCSFHVCLWRNDARPDLCGKICR